MEKNIKGEIDQGEVSLSDQVYTRIKERIMDQEYPAGTALTEAMLSKEFSVSKTPVKTAINQLTQEGWLETGFRKKVYVKPITEKMLKEFYEIREIFERAAIEKIFSTGQTWEYSFILEEALLHMKASVSDFYAFEKADAELHFKLISVFENDKIFAIYKNLNDEVVRMNTLIYKYNISTNKNYSAIIIDGFQHFIDAIRNKDEKQAEHYMIDVHMGISRGQALDSIRKYNAEINARKG